MDNTFDNKDIMIFVLVLIIVVLVVVLIVVQLYQSHQLETYYQIKNNNNVPDNVLYESPGLLQSYDPTNVDIVKQYDYHKSYDPLEDPTRRVPRHEIPPIAMKYAMDIPTRGYPDNYNQYGVLIREHDHDNKDTNNQNQIIRLFGRQTYPGSDRYEYYTMITSGNDLIKIPIHNRRRNELYDDDTIYIRELNGKYRVQLYKYDAPRYYP